jgi:hypothetical protein
MAGFGVLRRNIRGGRDRFSFFASVVVGVVVLSLSLFIILDSLSPSLFIALNSLKLKLKLTVGSACPGLARRSLTTVPRRGEVRRADDMALLSFFSSLKLLCSSFLFFSKCENLPLPTLLERKSKRKERADLALLFPPRATPLGTFSQALPFSRMRGASLSASTTAPCVRREVNLSKRSREGISNSSLPRKDWFFLGSPTAGARALGARSSTMPTVARASTVCLIEVELATAQKGPSRGARHVFLPLTSQPPSPVAVDVKSATPLIRSTTSTTTTSSSCPCCLSTSQGLVGLSRASHRIHASLTIQKYENKKRQNRRRLLLVLLLPLPSLAVPSPPPPPPLLVRFFLLVFDLLLFKSI